MPRVPTTRINAESAILTGIMRGEQGLEGWSKDDFIHPFHSSVFSMLQDFKVSGMSVPLSEIHSYISAKVIAQLGDVLDRAEGISLEEAIEEVKAGPARLEINLTNELRDFIAITNGNFSVTEALQAVAFHSKHNKALQPSQIITLRNKVRAILWRMAKDGEIHKVTDRNGIYEAINKDCKPLNFQSATGDILNVRWPFNLEQYVSLYPKSIVVVAGVSQAGKTAFLLNVVRLNMDEYPIFYFSSEMEENEYADRLSLFPGLKLDQWNFEAYHRARNFHDVIRPEAINIVDYLSLTDEFYKVGALIREIYDKLTTGLAIVAIQKNTYAEWGLGGERAVELARLYLTIDRGKLTIKKGKKWASMTNPDDLEIRFKLRQGCEFTADGDWGKD